MRFDRTEIAIRLRSIPELFDLSLVVLRAYWLPLLTSSALFSLPLLTLNVLATRWMLGPEGLSSMEDMQRPEYAAQNRFVWHMILLWFLEFPLASVPATILLGNRIFFEHLQFRRLLKVLKPVWLRSVFVLGVLRCGLLGLVLELFVNRYVPFDQFTELVLLFLAFCGWAAFRRMTHPFAPEILGLELCRTRNRRATDVTYWQRSTSLHSQFFGDCAARFILSVFVGSAFMLTTFSLFFVGDFVGMRQSESKLINGMLSTNTLVQILLPLAMWISSTYLIVFRFLCYLDIRIRLEGWEVELELKAERERLLQLHQPAVEFSMDAPEKVEAAT